jgi:hypothetical protein
VTYRIKITGFQKKLTLEILARTLQYSPTKPCYINRNQDHIGYVVLLRSITYAKRLMSKWHDKEIDGQMLKCQLELNPPHSRPKILSRSGSTSNLEVRENDSLHSSRNCRQSNNNITSSLESSASRATSDPEITTLDDQEFYQEARIFAQYRDSLVKQREVDAKHKARSTESLTTSAHSKCTTTADDRKMSEIRKKTDHGSSAFLVEYQKTDEENYRRELKALKLLEGKCNNYCNSKRSDFKQHIFFLYSRC